jgi:CheY-like chemotaxis protein
MTARVLIVEDNPANLELMRYLLAASGHAIMSVSNGEDGIDTARSEVPDLIICDIQLPRMTGIDVARELKRDRRLKEVPLVAVTAFAMLGDRDKLLHKGFDGYIAKPIDPESFSDQIDAFLPLAKRSAAKTLS